MAGNKNSGNRTGLPRAKGAGRKPKTARQRWLTGDAGHTRLAIVKTRPAQPAVVPAAAALPAIGPAGEVPAMLNEAEQAYWNLWAPLAVGNGTLTDSTRPGFVLLCQTAADIAEVRGDIRARGILFEKVDNVGGEETRELRKHPLWPEYRGLRARQEQLLARYGLAAFGRIVGGIPKDDEEERERAELLRLLAIR